MLVVCLCLIIPVLQQLKKHLLVVLTCNGLMAITWNVHSIELVVKLVTFSMAQAEVNWNNSDSGLLKELYVSFWHV